MPTVINKSNKPNAAAANYLGVGGKAAAVVNDIISKKVTKGKINFWYVDVWDRYYLI